MSQIYRTLTFVFLLAWQNSFAQQKQSLYPFLHDFCQPPSCATENDYLQKYYGMLRANWHFDFSNACYEVSDGCLTIRSCDEREAKGILYHWFTDYIFSSDSLRLSGEWLCRGGKAIATVKQGDNNVSNDSVRCIDKWQEFNLVIPYHYPEVCPLIAIDYDLAADGEFKLRNLRLSDNESEEETDTVMMESLPNDRLTVKSPLSKEIIRRLTKMCRVWGLMKYYYPSSRNLDIDWNKELFAMYRYVYDKDFDNKFEKHIYSYPLFPAGKKITTDEIIYGLHLQWINKRELSENLCCYLQKVLEIDLSEKEPMNVGYLTGQLEEKVTGFINEPAYLNATAEDVGHRLFSLFRFWNMIYYFHPYMRTMEKQWLNLLPEYIKLFALANSRLEYDDAVYRLCCELKDGHTRVYGLENNIESMRLWGGYYLNMSVVRVGNSVYVSDITPEVREITGFCKGDEILSVNGVSIKKIMASKAEYNTCPAMADQYGINYLCFNTDSVVYGIRRNDIKQKIIIKTETIYQSWAQPQKQKTIFNSCDLSDDIYYFNVGAATEDNCEDLIREATGYKSIIFDLRQYPRVERIRLERLLCEYILGKNPSYFHSSYVDMHSPGIFRMSSSSCFNNKIDEKRCYPGKIAILNDCHTISEGEVLTSLLKEHPNSVVIGYPTAGVMTPITWYPFISGIGARFTSGELYKNDKGMAVSAHSNVDIPVIPTDQVEHFSGDDVLMTAFNYLKEKNK